MDSVHPFLSDDFFRTVEDARWCKTKSMECINVKETVCTDRRIITLEAIERAY